MNQNNQRSKDRAEVLRLLERSGQNVAEFCWEQGLPYGVVSRWRRASRSVARDAVRWVELEAEVESAPPSAPGGDQSGSSRMVAEVSLGGGVTIRIYRQEGVAWWFSPGACGCASRI